MAEDHQVDEVLFLLLQVVVDVINVLVVGLQVTGDQLIKDPDTPVLEEPVGLATEVLLGAIPVQPRIKVTLAKHDIT